MEIELGTIQQVTEFGGQGREENPWFCLDGIMSESR